MKEEKEEYITEIDGKNLNERDNRPKWVIIFDRLTWAIAIILVIYLIFSHCPCKMIENDVTKEIACLGKAKGKEYICKMTEIPNMNTIKEGDPNDFGEWNSN